MKRRYFVVFSLALIVFLLVSMSPAFAQEPEKKLHFALVTHELGSGFFAPHKQACEDFAKTYNVTVDFMGPKIWDVNEHVNMLESLIAAKVDGIATTTPDSAAYDKIIQEALDAGIPVVGHNNDDTTPNPRMAFVGQFDYPAGRIAGEQAVKYAGGADAVKGKKAVIFICCPGFTALEDRARGIKDVLTENGMEVVGPVEYTADSTKVYGNIEAAYLANSDAIMLLSVDAFTEVLSRFVMQNNLGDQVVSGGWDMLPATMEGVQKGALKFTIGSNPYITAYYALTNLYFYATKGIMPVSIDTGVVLVDSTNIDKYIDVAKAEVAK